MRVHRAAAALLVLACLLSGSPLAEAACPKHRGHCRRNCVSPPCCHCLSDAASARGVTALVAQGDSLCEKNDLDGAIAAYTDAIRLDPSDVLALGHRGAVYAHNGDLHRALADSTEAIRVNPQFGYARILRGAIYMRMGEWHQAAADLDEAIRLDPKDSFAHLSRGTVYRMEGDEEKALAAFTEAIRLNPKNDEYYLTRANCLANMRRFTKAAADLDAAIQLGPDEPCFYEIRGALLVYCGDYDRAIADFQTMMRLNPADPAATFNEPAKAPLSAEALKHGREQLRQMLHDRPAMAKYGEKTAPLYEWAARKFAGENLHEPFLWNSAEPSPDTTAENHPPTGGQPGCIRVLGKDRTGPAQGKDRSFEELWHDAVFELYNIAGAKDFQRIEADAAAGTLSRDGFSEQMLDVESRAAEKTRAFYIRVFLPWAKEHGVPTQPCGWCVAWRSDPHENLVLGNVGKDDTSWRHYATWYDRVALGVLAAKGKYDEARKLAAEMLKRAATKQEAAEIYCAEGSAYAEKGDFDKALADYSEAIKADPKCVLAYQCRGLIYSNRGEHAKAVADLSEAIRVAPNDATSRWYRARAYSNKGDLENGTSDVLDALRITPAMAGIFKPQWIYICLQAARGHDENRDFDRAIADCSQALRLDPTNAHAYHTRGYVYLGKQDYAKATADLNEAIRLDPNDAIAHHNRAATYFWNGDFDNAIAGFVEAIRLGPITADQIKPSLTAAYLRRARDRAAKHDWDGAIADLTEAQRLTSVPSPLDVPDTAALVAAATQPPTFGWPAPDPSQLNSQFADPLSPAPDGLPMAGQPRPSSPPPAYYGSAGSPPTIRTDLPGMDPLGFNRSSLGYQYHHSEWDAPRPQSTDEITPRLIDAYIGRAAERTSKGKLDGAVADLTDALRLDPRRSSALMDRGNLYQRMGQHKKAAADFSEVVRLDRDGREAYLNRGVALLDGGDTDAAIADFTEAINRDRYTPFAAYCRRAEAFLKKGDLKAASQDADAALRVNPNYADAYRCRGRIREKMGQQAKAAADFAQAKRLGNLTK